MSWQCQHLLVNYLIIIATAGAENELDLRDKNGLQSYHRLRGEKDRAQLTAVFDGESKNRFPISQQPQYIEKGLRHEAGTHSHSPIKSQKIEKDAAEAPSSYFTAALNASNCKLNIN